jgi:hypothetical protein
VSKADDDAQLDDLLVEADERVLNAVASRLDLDRGRAAIFAEALLPENIVVSEIAPGAEQPPPSPDN